VPLPKAFSSGFAPPCIPTRAARPPAGPDCVHEIKHDGYRLIARHDGETVRLFTRRGYDWTGGSLNFDASGRYMQVVAARGRPKATTGPNISRADIKPEEYKALAQGVVANFGTWSVNETDKTLTRKAEGALFPNAEGVETKFSVNLAGDELKLGATNNPAAGATVWRRAK
jgi:hypothetical protein